MTLARRRIAAGAIALIAWVALALYATDERGLVGSWTIAIAHLLRYFTIWTNVLDAVLFSAFALGLTAFVRPRIAAGLALANALVGIVYWTLLHASSETTGASAFASLLAHGGTSLGVPLFWVGCVPKGRCGRFDPLLWSLYPLAYFAFALAYGAASGFYAYRFVDAASIGYASVARNAVAIAGVFVLAGAALVALDGALARRERSAAPRST